MSEETLQPSPIPEPDPGATPRRKRPLLWCGTGFAILLAALVIGLTAWVNSAQFADMMRKRIVTELENATGGRVEIGSFAWSLRHLEADVDNVVLHGDEAANEAPYIRFEHLHVGVSILGFLSPKVLLCDLVIEKPHVHMIVYPNQTTNLPHPRKPAKQSTSGMDTLFDLKAGHVAAEQGMIDFDNRAEAFDFKSRYIPLDFEANDTSIVMQYAAAHGKTPESYHIEAGIADLSMQRGKQRNQPQVQGVLHASVDLTRNSAFLRSLQITAHAHRIKDNTLNVSGSVTDFAHPRWQAKVVGDLDLHLLDPVLGYPDAPEGIAHLNLDCDGAGSQFRIDGPVHVEHASYTGNGVTARDIDVTALAHADLSELHIAQAVIKPRQGGQINADVLITRWLPQAPVQTKDVFAPATPEKPQYRHLDILSRFHKKQAPANTQSAATPPAHEVLVKNPVYPLFADGKITATLKGLALDTVLDMVSHGPFQRLGLGAVFDGPAEATWSKGDIKTLSVHAILNARAPLQTQTGEVPAYGLLDAIYTQRDGGVEVKTLRLTTPKSTLDAHGHVGAYPLTSAMSLNVDGDSRDLSEFDVVLRDLGLNREGKRGVAALPVALHGEGQFQVLWAGSLLSPRITGTLKATQIGIEIPPSAETPNAQPKWIAWDEADAEGSYDAEHIAIMHGHMQRGTSEITLDGTLAAAEPEHSTRKPRGQAGVDEMPEFSGSSLLHAHVHASKVLISDLLPLAGVSAPVTGTLDTQIEADGLISSLGGSGWVQLTDGVVYGEPIAHARAQGTLANHVIHVSAFTAQAPTGTIAASGSYDLHAERFDVEAHGSNLEITKVKHLEPLTESVQGRLTFAATASGTRNDPRVEGHAEATGLMVQGAALGSAQLTAHTVNGALVYDLTSHTETADAKVHGQTTLHGDFDTQAQAEFSRFNVGSILRLSHVQSIHAESAMAGAATISGPLAHVDLIRGDLRLDRAEMSVQGVNLHSEGAVHASLAALRVQLDPVHIVGDQTDLRAQGSLELKGKRQLDMAANGNVNLKLAETLDHDLTANGNTTFQVEAHGPVADPQLRGRIDFQDGSLSLEDIPNGLSHIHGTLEFNQNRLEVRSLTAMTGGGQLTVGGYLAYQHGIYADLTATGKNIRIRYPQGVSSQADTTLHLQGTQASMQVTGNVMLTRFTVSPDLDIAALAAQASTMQTVAAPDAPSNHIRLDVHIQSSPQLNFQNAIAKLAGDVDLRLRGTVATPSLIGRVSVTEGSANIAGTRYDLQRGEITFNNPVRIQPVIDLNATARVEDYDITLSLNGTPDKLNVSYRSDPPLPESDVVALLAVGRTQSEQGLYTAQQQSAAQNNTTDVLLGGALNATVSSRMQKLFGAGSVKVDPSYLGALGNSTTRITVEEQLGRYVTLTYATNVDTSAQQLLQAEIAINRHVSLQVERDESGVFSMVLKNTRRYR